MYSTRHISLDFKMAMCAVTRIFLVCLIFSVACPECSYACEQGMSILNCCKFYGGETFLKYATLTGILETLNQTKDASLFLPTDTAFRRLPSAVTSNTNTMKEVLLYHVLHQSTDTAKMVNEQLLQSDASGGQKVRFNQYSKANTTVITSSGAVIIVGDEKATNGVLHLVDRVMYPLPGGSLYEYIANTATYQTLLLLVAKAQLLDTLKGGTYTMFAPNDKAFSKLPAGAVAGLLSDIPKLKKVLENHLVSSTIYSAGLKVVGSGKTLSGADFSASGDTLIFGSVNATIVSADRSATNGVLHEIDTVLM